MAHDVFISFKNSDENGRATKDSAVAQKLYSYLSGKGLRVFFSSVELEYTGRAQYTRVIDDALDSSRFLIAVGCSCGNLNSQWVRYEWESFLNDIRSGIKSNAEVFVLYKDMKVSELPRALRQQQAFDADDKASMEKLYNFIKNALGEVPAPLGPDLESEKRPFPLKALLIGAIVLLFGLCVTLGVNAFRGRAPAEPVDAGASTSGETSTEAITTGETTIGEITTEAATAMTTTAAALAAPLAADITTTKPLATEKPVVTEKPTTTTAKPTTANQEVDADALFAQGLRELKFKNYNAAISTYTQYLQLRPGEPLALSNRGLAYTCIGNYTASFADYDAAIAHRNVDGWLESMIRLNRAKTHYMMGNTSAERNENNLAANVGKAPASIGRQPIEMHMIRMATTTIPAVFAYRWPQPFPKEYL